MLAEILSLDLTTFNQTLQTKKFIRPTLAELDQLIKEKELSYVWLPSCPRSARVTMTLDYYGVLDRLEVIELNPTRRSDETWTLPQTQASLASLFGKNQQVTHPILIDQSNQSVVYSDPYHFSLDVAQLMDLIGQHSIESSLYPLPYQDLLDKWNAWIYTNVNTKIYQVTYQTGSARIKGEKELASTYAQLNNYLADKQYLVQEQLTETDLRLFNNLVRHIFYYRQFQVFDQPLNAYPNLLSYTQRILAIPIIKKHVNFDLMRQTHFMSDHNISRYGKVPVIPSVTRLSQIER